MIKISRHLGVAHQTMLSGLRFVRGGLVSEALVGAINRNPFASRSGSRTVRNV